MEERGAPIPAYLMPPDEVPGIAPWFAAFWELRTERLFAEGPIPAKAIREYPVSPSEADIFAACIRAADAAYLEFLAKPAEERKSLEPLRPGFFKGKKPNG